MTKKGKNIVRIGGVALSSYLFLQALGYSPTHYQTFINFIAFLVIYFMGRMIYQAPVEDQWKIGVALIIIGAMLRFGWARFIPTIPKNDFDYYHQWAMDFSASGIPLALPKNYLYPLLLSLGYRIFPNLITAKFLQALASSMSIGLIWLIAKRINPKVASLSALLFTFFPSEINMVSVVGTEVVSTTLLLAISYFLVIGIQEKRLKWLMASGVLSGMGIHFRSAIIFYLPVMIIFLWFTWKQIERRNIAAASFLMGIMTLQLALTVGHSLLVGQFTIASLKTQDSYPFLSGTNVEYSGMWNQEDSDLYSSWPDAERDRLARRKALQRIIANPLGFMRMVIVKISILFRDNTYGNLVSLQPLDWDRWTNFKYVTENNITKLNGALSQALYIVIWGFTWISFFQKEIKIASISALLIILVTAAPHIILEVQPRYHHLMMPFIIFAAASGFEFVIQKWNIRGWLFAN